MAEVCLRLAFGWVRGWAASNRDGVRGEDNIAATLDNESLLIKERCLPFAFQSSSEGIASDFQYVMRNKDAARVKFINNFLCLDRFISERSCNKYILKKQGIEIPVSFLHCSPPSSRRA